MSYLSAVPELMVSAATDIAGIGSTLTAAHTAAAVPTSAIIPAAADEVSGAVAHLFSAHGAGFQALAGKAAAFHEQFVGNLKAGAASYTGAEAANASMVNASAGSFVSLIQTLENLPVLGPLLTPLFALLGVSLFLLVLVAAWILSTVQGFLGQFGL